MCAIAVSVPVSLGACSTQTPSTPMPTVTKTVTVTVTAAPSPQSTTVAPVQAPNKPPVNTPSSTAAPSAPTAAPAPTTTPAAPVAAQATALPTLQSIGAKCPIAVRGNNAPVFNDGGNGLAFIGDIANYQPTQSAILCAEARLAAGGYTIPQVPGRYVMSTMTSKAHPGTFHVLQARVGFNHNPQCVLPFTIMDYEGNISLFKDDEPVGMTNDGANIINWSAKKVAGQFQVLFDNCI